MFFQKIAIFLLFTSFFFTLNADYSNAIKIKKIYPMGEKIYKSSCDEISLSTYEDKNALEKAILSSNLCKKLSDKHLEALSLYLWDVKRVETYEKVEDEIRVTKDEKCPICGMYVYKYPKWAAQIFYHDKKYSFDGMKDLMKYYFQNQKNIEKILVRDYYSQKTIDATKAFYVVGSDIYGPMGAEFIAFAHERSAKSFLQDHKGVKIIHFSDINKEEVYKLDE